MLGTYQQAHALAGLMRAYSAQEFELIPLGPKDLCVLSVDLYADDHEDAVAHATITPGGTVREASRA